RRGQSRRPRGRPRARRAAHGRDPQAGQHPAGARDHRAPGGRRDRAASRPRTGPGGRAARAPGLAGAIVGLAFEDGPDALKQAERSLRHVVALRSFGRACRLRAATLPTGATALAARSPIAAGTSAVAVASLPPAPVTVRFASRVAFRPARGGLVAGRTCGAPAATAPASPAAPGLRRFLVLVPTVIPDGLAGAPIGRRLLTNGVTRSSGALRVRALAFGAGRPVVRAGRAAAASPSAAATLFAGLCLGVRLGACRCAIVRG